MQHTRSRRLFQAIEADSKELERLKFCHDSTVYDRDWREKLSPALKMYRQQFGHCSVPFSFTVPSNETWPRRSWGLKLGSVVKNIRNGEYAAQVARDKPQLEALGFAWDFYESEWTECILPALSAFRRVKHHCKVPFSFTVPSNETWPRRSWGLKLGFVVNNIRKADAYAAQVTRDKPQLEALGFVWDAYEWEWSERILPALTMFHQLNGHCRVPKAFVVPLEENWPEQSRGLKLSIRVEGIRHMGYYAAQVARDKSRLMAMGFVWNVYEAEWMERILPAWEVFYKMRGHCRVPRSFVVPSEAPWPIQAHGMTLGNSVRNIRRKGGYFDYAVRSMDSLEAIEFELKIPASKWTKRVEPLLATFEQLHGHRNVPSGFVVPSEVPWEERDWGVQLGKLKRKTPSQEG